MTRLRELAGLPPGTRHNVARRVAQMIVFDGLMALLLFACAGTLAWPYAWLYTAAAVVVQLVGALTMPLDMVAERGSRKEGTETWDTVLAGLLMVAFFSIYLVAGLDYRWQATGPVAVGWHLAGGAVFVLGCALEMWAMRANRFFSTAVRMQLDRGHAVASGGPYRYVRHPGYVGMILQVTGTPVLLGSLWALIPGAAMVLLLIVRTRLEDRTLRRKLPGYDEYAARVRCRLLPGVW
jgi:protein-S-isoprenylcysteine O-methyltransferase Ste14